MAAATDAPTFNIVVALFPGVTQLDFTGPHQVLARLPGAKITAASLDGGEIEADGLVFGRLPTLASIDASKIDILLVPGGIGTGQAVENAAFIEQIKRLAAHAKYITSVCTGSLILGAAGLLKGKRAATHWAWRHSLPLYGAIPDDARVVRDGNIFTGGGVTAGIDFALTIVAEIAGPEAAQAIQLGIEYAPAPPFNSGRPELAPPEVLARVQGRYKERVDEVENAAKKAAIV
ncbi:Isonitrile hydratase [Vanrija pseudolonga]|uniref:Isonitrile hydratase n=1 Tax=Vanrija pseudolonga TaxID=143232 RepID=A0AAF0Y2L1_9TREE|nr:Isonitrile hydratase [Vanrija pseudolonga]